MSDIHNFTTPLPAGDSTPYSFIVYGDMGITPFPRGTTTADLARREVEKNNARFILHHGDISYAMGYVSDFSAKFTIIAAGVVAELVN